ncbi:short chain dehydrogenase [Arthrobacter crystallopoietes BAB-32]|uniref:Short chain dehydrogenase n=1 Tax=Arthrobacter crystallopoietes BAB-32 TaxID=1246476 RepID=N1V0I4_9MICC|nr:SDR family oxidoreductase [Arthrobacter crystallopoietes]EMY33554.1 short chain dehydrogenase [Arthrobacter crystallopoietes BAB-32]
MKHLLVTGGSRGIGAAIVRASAGRGHPVTFSFNGDHHGASSLIDELKAAGHRAQAVQADAALPRDHLFRRAEEEFGPVELLVNNAGITGPLGPFANSTDEDARLIFDVNVHGTMGYSRMAVQRWLDRGTRGVIVNISSIAATTGAPGEYVAYAASKAAVETFTRGLGKELGPAGIRVVAVSPGTTDTTIHATAGDPNRPQRVAERVPLRRVAEPQEIAAAVMWALSDESSYVTGTVITVAGGL